MVRNLSALLETADADEELERMRFYRSLVPNAVIFLDTSGFVCGLCGKGHHNRNAASQCLQTCIASRQNEGVVNVTTLGEHYSCPTCNRHFARREDAIDCHGRARRLSKIFLKELPKRGIRSWDDSGFAGLKELDTPGQGRLFRSALRLEAMVSFATKHDFSGARPPGRLKTVVAQGVSESSQNIAVHFEEAEVVNPPPAPLAPPLAGAGASPQTLPVAAPEPKAGPVVPAVTEPEEYTSGVVNDAGPYREPGMKPFTRADARYKCTVCSQMYFTRSEVENCFFAHPERP